MKKEKRLSRADGLNVLRDAYDLIRDEKEDFMCLAIKSAGIMHGVKCRVSAIEMIPELDFFQAMREKSGRRMVPVGNEGQEVTYIEKIDNVL